MIEDNSFDTIYHEHFSYWSLENLNFIFNKYELNIFDVSFLPVHHGQLRIYISKSKKFKKTKSLKDLINLEKSEDLTGNKLMAFCKKVTDTRKILLSLFEKISREGKKISGYGAPAKS